MKFFRNNAYWILGILIGIGISTVILILRGQQKDAETTQHGPSAKPEQQGIAQVSPENAAKPPPPGETPESGYWHGDHWHKTSPPQVLPPAKRKRTAKSSTQKNLPLKQWTHGPHIGHYHPPKNTWPNYADYGLSQEQIDRIEELGLQWQAEYGDEAFFNRRWEQKGQTQEEWEAEGHRKQVDNITADMDAINAFKYLAATSPIRNPSQHLSAYRHSRFYEYLPEFAERAVAENPDFLKGHLFLAQQEKDPARAIETYREIVEHPDVHTALSPTDAVTAFDSLGGLLVMEQPVESIEYFKQATNIDPKSGLYGLSVAYQRLGDLKTAWVYLKKLQTYPHHAELDRYVEAIEAGKPWIDPLPRTSAPPAAKKELPSEVWDAFPEGTSDTEKPFHPDTEWDPRTPAQNTAPGANTHPDAERARAAAQQAHEHFQKQHERALQELNDFFDFAQTVFNADNPMNTNNFLLKDMEAFFKGGQPKFDPDRIIRAFETFERYGAKEGIKHLQKSDLDVAEAVLQLLTEKRKSTPKK